MKVLFVGDVHNHLYMFKDIEELDQRYNFDEIIFFGDYVDDWNTTGKDSLLTLDKIFNLKMGNTAKYTLLLGNHELSYLAYPCAGYDFEFGELLKQKLLNNYNLLDLYKVVKLGNRDFICSHAGLTNPYIKLELNYINNNWQEALDIVKEEKQFNYLRICSRKRGGQELYSSLVWADIDEHLDMFDFLEVCDLTKYQIIGHSPVKEIMNYNRDNFYDYWFIDTHSTYRNGTPYGDKSYLIWNTNRFEKVKI